MTLERYANVFDAIASVPAEAENIKLRARLMDMLRQRIESELWTQTEAANRLGVSQPRISDLMRGKISLFSLDMLVQMLAASGIVLEVTAKAAGVTPFGDPSGPGARTRQKSGERAA